MVAATTAVNMGKWFKNKDVYTPMKVLIANDAQLEIKNNTGQTVFDYLLPEAREILLKERQKRRESKMQTFRLGRLDDNCIISRLPKKVVDTIHEKVRTAYQQEEERANNK